MEPLSQTKNAVATILQQHGVVLGYVFGSYAHDRLTPLSDVDIALVFQDTPRNEYFERELAISNAISKLLGIERVDVVNLITVTNPLLKQQATLRGVCIVDQDHYLRLKLEHRILQEYEDTQYLRTVQSHILHRQIQDVTFGKPVISPYGSN